MRKVLGRAYLCGAVALGSYLICAAGRGQTAAPQGPARPFFPPFGLDLTAVDPHTRPGDDFFQYANGAWLARTPIPPDKPYMTEAQAIRDRVQLQLRQIIEAAAAHAGPEPTDLAGKVGAFYRSFMNTAQRAALGAKPIAAELAAIRSSRTRPQLARLMGHATDGFEGGFFQLTIDVDLKDVAHYAVYLSQAGLTMPDRDYYLEASLAPKKAQFRSYVQRMLTLIDWPQPADNADAIVALETRIAEASWRKAEQRELDKIYNPLTTAELDKFAPGLPWHELLQGAHLPDAQRVVIAEKTAFPKIARIFANTPVSTLQAWLAFTTADAAAPYLSDPFVQANFDFHRTALLGVKQRPPLWKEGISAISGGDCAAGTRECFGTLDWAVGQLYTAKYFPPATKAKAGAMARSIMQAYRHRIEKLEWMAPATKAEALRKLDTYVIKVGYPDKPRDYSRVVVRADDLIGNVRRAASADWAFYVARRSGPVDKSDWIMTPQTVDAYNGTLRDIVFPAAILQPPEFDPAADAAVNFGAAGTLFGHELTHGFDDEGRKLDATGALRNWWTAADDQAFKQRAQVLGAQFAQYEPVPGVHIKPDLTMGENIADLGGVVIALDAYHASLPQGQDGAAGTTAAPVIDGLTGDQRFFRSYAQDWRGKGTDDYIRDLTISNPHSWRAFRVNGIVRNVDAWYLAFGVKPGDKLYVEPPKRARIW
jgi:putative endopeptidase